MIDIVIPIFNAFDEVQLCVESVLQHTDPKNLIWLLDDGSTDKRISEMGGALARKHLRVRSLRSEINRGFVATANWGFELTSSDVVILNSDTIVTNGWLKRMTNCLESDPLIGIVSPLSNNGWILSFPKNLFDNSIPLGWNLETFSEQVAINSSRDYPRVPSAVGYCILIARRVIDAVGGFDEVFSPGYCEENDLCLRARQAGFESACSDDVFIFHKGAASFGRGAERDALVGRSQRLLEFLYPGIDNEFQAFVKRDPFAKLREKLGV